MAGRPRRPIEPILALLIEGKEPKQIGDALHICPDAVTYHLKRWKREQGCKTLIQAVAKFVKEEK
jgi:DNA-binding NarL/FixJ family response regulator